MGVADALADGPGTSAELAEATGTLLAAILRNIREAMRPDARVLILEQVMPETVTPQTAGIVRNDLNMLVSTGGRERTEAEFRDLLAAAGFTGVSLTGPLAPASYPIIEAHPAR